MYVQKAINNMEGMSGIDIWFQQPQWQFLNTYTVIIIVVIITRDK